MLQNIQNPYKQEDDIKREIGAWSPYLAGALSGVVGVLSVWFAGQYFGASTSFVRTAGMVGILGMIVGAGLFAEAFAFLEKTVYTWGNFGRITLPQLLGVSHWVIIPLFIAGALLLFRWLEKKGL